MLKFLKKLTSPLTQKIRNLFSKPIDESAFEELEKIFYEADLGAYLASDLVEKVRHLYRKKQELSTEEVLDFVKQELLKEMPNAPSIEAHPKVILLVGVNGSGKTTSLAKLASYFLEKGQKVLVAAADTFRAAAIDQLEIWAKKVGVDLIRSQPGADPSGVVFDAVKAGKARGSDLILIDTAGRLQTKTELMHELKKIKQVCQKQIEDAPHETLLVLDATIGQNAIDQAKIFHQFTPLSGIILTKLDGSAKGGIAIAIQKELQIPIRWIGTGEKKEDFEPFEPKAFLDALFS